MLYEDVTGYCRSKTEKRDGAENNVGEDTRHRKKGDGVVGKEIACGLGKGEGQRGEGPAAEPKGEAGESGDKELRCGRERGESCIEPKVTNSEWNRREDDHEQAG